MTRIGGSARGTVSPTEAIGVGVRPRCTGKRAATVPRKTSPRVHGDSRIRREPAVFGRSGPICPKRLPTPPIITTPCSLQIWGLFSTNQHALPFLLLSVDPQEPEIALASAAKVYRRNRRPNAKQLLPDFDASVDSMKEVTASKK